MPRLPRVVVPGLPHHVTQRGNQKCDIYLDKEDRQVYLQITRSRCQQRGIEIHAYCLMSNHVHLVVTPDQQDSLSKGLRDSHGLYALFFNRKYDRTGHLWQGRFFSCILDEPHFWSAIRYVELNPVRAGMVEKAELYKWSSAPARCGLREDPLFSQAGIPGQPGSDWSSWLAGESSADELRLIREKTRTGRPWGSDVFIKHLESRLKRTLKARRVGRPRATGSIQKNR